MWERCLLLLQDTANEIEWCVCKGYQSAVKDSCCDLRSACLELVSRSGKKWDGMKPQKGGKNKSCDIIDL